MVLCREADCIGVWESPVRVFKQLLSSIYFGDFQIACSPFVLIHEDLSDYTMKFWILVVHLRNSTIRTCKSRLQAAGLAPEAVPIAASSSSSWLPPRDEPRRSGAAVVLAI